MGVVGTDDFRPATAVKIHVAADLARGSIRVDPVGATANARATIPQGQTRGRSGGLGFAQAQFASVGADVVVILVAVVTGLNITADKAIAAAGSGAVRDTGVTVIIIAIIAVFYTGPDHGITADRCLAVVQTSVVVGLIAIIAGFCAGLAGFKVDPGDAITAGGRLAGIRTGIIRIFITIITKLFSLVKLPVAASGPFAVGEAGIILKVIAIVTLFCADRSRLQIVADDAIAAASGGAGVGACVAIHSVAIVTDFLALMNQPVATSGPAAIPNACITVVFIAVVALLADL